MLNGEPGDVIQHQRELRQGDPLSPMLFILVMDVLNSLFVKAGEEGLCNPSTKGFLDSDSLCMPMMLLSL
jgi:hypothetical protein